MKERISNTKDEVKPKIMKGTNVPNAKGRIKNITRSRKVNKGYENAVIEPGGQRKELIGPGNRAVLELQGSETNRLKVVFRLHNEDVTSKCWVIPGYSWLSCL